VVVIPAVLDGYAVSSIGDDAFLCCSDITGVTIPDGISSIGNEAFGGCSGLESVTIPDSVTSMGVNPFTFCESLTAVEVSSGHPTLAMVDGVLYSKPDNRIVWYPMTLTASSFSIPEGITTIGANSFAYNRYLTGVTIPDSVTAIEATAFA